MSSLGKADKTAKLVLEQVVERRRLKQSVVLRDIGRALNMSVGAIWNALRRLEAKGLLKDAPCTVVEVGPSPTPRGLELLKKAS